MYTKRIPQLTNRRIQVFTLGVGLAAAFFGGVYLRRRQSPYQGLLGIWLQALRAEHGEWFARYLITRVQQRLQALLRQQRFPAHPALQWHLRSQVLPGLALYQVLQSEFDNRQAALLETEKLFKEAARKAAWPAAGFQWLPDPFPVLRLLIKPLMQLVYPAAGWETRWIEDSPRAVAFDIHRCLYLNTLTAYGAAELTPLFCQMDDTMAAAFPGQIAFRRTNTLARGGDRCDFQYWDARFPPAARSIELERQ